MTIYYPLILAISFIITFILVPVFIKVAKRYDFLDYPTTLKRHSRPTPILGGEPVFLGFLGAILLVTHLFHIPWGDELKALVAGGAIVVIVGLIDDKKGLSPSAKFLGQLIAALLFIFLSHSQGILTGTTLDLVVLLLWLTGMMNALNFLDAMDGLCGGITFISAFAFMILGVFSVNPIMIIVSLAIMGSLAGFLRYNLPPAKIFLGDAGSMLNGFVLAALGILFAKYNPSPLTLLVPIMILSYPIFDISFVTLMRVREGRKIYMADYNNSPPRIAQMGVERPKVVWWIYSICAILGGLGVLLYVFFESPVKVLVFVFAGLGLTIFGVHLHRNFVNLKEKLLLIFCDVLVINIVFLLFYWFRFKSGLVSAQVFIPLSEYVGPAIWITLYWLNLFAIMGLYETSWDQLIKDIWKSIAKMVSIGIGIFVILTLNPSYLSFNSWFFLLIYGFLLSFILGLERTLILLFERNSYSKGNVFHRAVIVGTQENAKSLFKEIRSNPHLGYQVMGLVSHNSETKDKEIEGLKVLGNLEIMDEIVKAYRIQDILIALEPNFSGSLNHVIEKVNDIEVRFKITPKLKSWYRGNRTSRLNYPFLMRIYPSQLRAWEWVLKRLFDLALACFLLLVSSPLLFLSWLVTQIRYGSPALIQRECVGIKNRTFRLYKFKINKKEKKLSPFPVFSYQVEDSWGKFIRDSGLEILPSLINVLKGEMSLVGPEPHSRDDFQKLSSKHSLYPKRLLVKPGILSPAKVEAKPSDILYGKDLPNPFEQRLEYDLRYAENLSLLLDLKVLLLSFFTPLVRSGNA
jgi:UDP-GlcNAc:undecaprenyl-phosphate GlcNAc-1-phosphate transferase